MQLPIEYVRRSPFSNFSDWCDAELKRKKEKKIIKYVDNQQVAVYQRAAIIALAIVHEKR